MMYEKNLRVLKEVVAQRAVIRHVSKHRKADGSFDLEGNKKIWNAALERFDGIPLWDAGAPDFDNRDPLQPQPSIVFIPNEQMARHKGTIIVAHGGGFESRTGCEGMNVALHFAQSGFNAAILTYRLRPYTRAHAIQDMQRAIRLLRHHREALGISEKVAIMGFSAGGMLCGNCATHFDLGIADASDPADRRSCRPDAAVIAYGAFSSIAFPGGFMQNPFTEENRAQKLYLAPEHNLSHESPPFFVWQTNGDDPRHAFVLCDALTRAGVPFELHCFAEGAHGLALADGENDLSAHHPHVMHWASLCAEWLSGQGI